MDQDIAESLRESSAQFEGPPTWESLRRIERAGHRIPYSLWKRLRRSSRRFSSDLPLKLWAEVPSGEIKDLGCSPTRPGEYLDLPINRIWGVTATQISQDNLGDLISTIQSKGIPALRFMGPTVHINHWEPLKAADRLEQIEYKGHFRLFPRGKSKGIEVLNKLPKLRSIHWVEFPFDAIKHLDSCPALQQLSLPYPDSRDCSRSSLSELETLSLLPTLTSLDISGWSDDITPADLSQMPNLNSLESLKYGESISRKESKDHELPALQEFPKLRALNLGMAYSYSDSSSVQLAKLSGLEELSLLGCYRLRKEGFNELTALEKLRKLELRGCYLDTDALTGLQELSELRSLEIGHWDYSGGDEYDEGIWKTIAQLPKIESLCLEAKLNAESVPELETLKSLDLVFGNITPGGLHRICSNRNLEQLKINIEDKSFQSIDLDCFASLGKLRVLELNGGEFWNETSLRFLSSLTELEELTFGPKTQIKPEHFGVLESLPKLRFLKLFQRTNTLSPGLVESLACIPRLEVLQLFNTHASAHEFSAFQNSPSIRRIRVTKLHKEKGDKGVFLNSQLVDIRSGWES